MQQVLLAGDQKREEDQDFALQGIDRGVVMAGSDEEQAGAAFPGEVAEEELGVEVEVGDGEPMVVGIPPTGKQVFRLIGIGIGKMYATQQRKNKVIWKNAIPV